MGETLDPGEEYKNWKAPDTSSDYEKNMQKIRDRVEKEQPKGVEITNVDTIAPGSIDQTAQTQTTDETENAEPLLPQETRGRSFIEKAKDRLGKIDKDAAMQVIGSLAAVGMFTVGLGESTVLASQYSHDLTNQSLLVASGIGHMALSMFAIGSVRSQ